MDGALNGTTYYGALRLLTHDLRETNLHVTIWYRNDTSEAVYQEVSKEFTAMVEMLKGRSVRITDYTFLGPIEACLLEIEEGPDKPLFTSLSKFSNDRSFRKKLDVQFSFTLHTSKGDPKSSNPEKLKEYRDNSKLIEENGGLGSRLIFGGGYIKNMDTKAVVLAV